MPQDGLGSLLTEAGLAIGPLRDLHTPDQAVAFFKQLGYNFGPGSIGSALSAVAGQAGELIAAAQQLVNSANDSARAAAAINLLGRLGAAANAIHQLETRLGGGGGGDISQFARRLLDFVILDYLDKQKSQLHELLHLVGLIDKESSPPAGQPQRQIHWERLGTFLTSPVQIANDVYQWNTAFDAQKFLTRLAGVMRATSLPGGLYPQSETTRALLGNATPGLQELRFPIFQQGFTAATYAQFGITFSPAEARAGQKAGFALLPYLMGTAAFNFGVCDRGELVFTSTGDIKGVGLVIRPPFDAQGLLNLTGSFRAAIDIHEKPSASEELILVGTAGGTRLSIQGLGVSWFAQNPQGKLDVGVEGRIQALKLVIKGGEGDGFLDKLLSGVNIEAQAQIGLGFSLLGGFTFTGGAQLAIELPAHIDLGPIHLDSMRFALAPAADKLKLDAGVTVRADLGPLKASVENIGLTVALEFHRGNLGPADLGVSFKPPNGVGLSIDAGIVKGGGFLYVDAERGEYAGALQLVFSGFLNLNAIGLITTRMPDGSKGFSLLIIITAEFGTGIQLGFGFTLLGVGGLIGLNRTMKLQPLMEGVRSGAINGIMFPQDVVANAPRIISDLRTIFPPQEGTFLIGPMAKLGWGTPTLVSLALGIIIEIPGNIAIVGVLRVALPTSDAALLVLQVNFAGAIEFDKKRLFFFAALFESRVLFMTIEGEMGLLVAFGDDANFVLSVGGFHVQYNPPPLPFPSPRRISINIANSPTARIRAEAYFAVTSNTVQFGCAAELVFGFDDFGIHGHIAFDALFQFSPFHFIIQISASLSLEAFGIGLFSISLDFSLEGTSPWRAKGRGSISLLFFDISADFDITWGESRNTTLPPVAVMPLLLAEFNKLESWRAIPPAASNTLVSLPQLDDTNALVLHPSGTLRVSQKAVPLDLGIDKVGSQAPSDAKRFTLTVVTAALEKRADALESFAAAQYENMGDATKLSRPAFEAMHGGLELRAKGQDLGSGKAAKRSIRYDEIIIDNNYKRFVRRFLLFSGALFDHFLLGSSVALSPLSQASRQKLQPFPDTVKVSSTMYTVAFTSNNKPFNASATFASAAMAHDFAARSLSEDPTLADEIHVIPHSEVNA